MGINQGRRFALKTLLAIVPISFFVRLSAATKQGKSAQSSSTQSTPALNDSISKQGNRIMKCQITVLKTTLHKDLADEYCLHPVEACPVFKEGHQYVYDHFGDGNKPAGFCEHAWHDIYMDINTLMSNGDYEGWMKKKGQTIACCTDGIRPVVFKLERVTG